jgi:hypothetical protein
MSKDGDDVEILPAKCDGFGGKATPIKGTPMGSHVEQLSFELKQLKLYGKIDKLKKKLKDSKSRQLTSSFSLNEETDDSSKEVKGKIERKGDKRSYNTTSVNFDNLPPSNGFTSVPVDKALHFNGTDYTKWRYSMKMHLISLNTSVWTIVRTRVEFTDEDEEPGYEQLQQIHRNAQASLVLLSSLYMYKRLKKLVNKVRAYGSKRWGDRRMIERILRAYVVKDTMVIS